MKRFYCGLGTLVWLLLVSGNHAVAQSFHIGSGGIGFGYSSGHNGHHGGHHGGYHGGHHGGYHGGHHDGYSFGLHLGSDYGYRSDHYSDDYYYPRTYSAPRRETARFVDAPPVPSSSQLARMPREDLIQLLQAGAEELNDELTDLSTGDGWARHLHLQSLSDLSGSHTDSELAEITALFNSTAEKPEFEMIASLWGFRTVHGVLVELMVPPASRHRRQLEETTEWLSHSLSKLTTGKGWKEHLKLAALEETLSTAGEEGSLSDAAIRDSLLAILTTFDRVRDDASFKVIADLPAFQVTHEIMASYCDLLKSAGPIEAPVPPEE